ncbi:MAG TPA: thermonuclease family protein [Thermodesulfobacteriota bacterium]
MRRVLLIIALLLIPHSAWALVSGMYLVTEVIDGDTIVLANGERVRYIGVNAPEVNEPFWLDAKARNMALVMSKMVEVSVCGPEPTDRYGRVLAWVSYNGQMVNETLLREGYARTLVIPPCGVITERRFDAAEAQARDAGRGIWGQAQTEAVPTITPDAARMYIGRTVRVRGVVMGVRPLGRNWALDFGGIDGFKAVVLPRVIIDYNRRGQSLLDLAGKEVSVTGTVTFYRGSPEILIDSPSRIE